LEIVRNEADMFIFLMRGQITCLTEKDVMVAQLIQEMAGNGTEPPLFSLFLVIQQLFKIYVTWGHHGNL
jgi:hypothetical protein